MLHWMTWTEYVQRTINKVKFRNITEPASFLTELAK